MARTASSARSLLVRDRSHQPWVMAVAGLLTVAWTSGGGSGIRTTRKRALAAWPSAVTENGDS